MIKKYSGGDTFTNYRKCILIPKERGCAEL